MLKAFGSSSDAESSSLSTSSLSQAVGLINCHKIKPRYVLVVNATRDTGMHNRAIVAGLHLTNLFVFILKGLLDVSI